MTTRGRDAYIVFVAMVRLVARQSQPAPSTSQLRDRRRSVRAEKIVKRSIDILLAKASPVAGNRTRRF